MSWATTKRIGAFLTDLIFPRTCAICRVRLTEREHCVCMECATKLPRHTPAFVHADERLLGSPLIRSLSAPFIYQHANPTYDLIIALKYRGYGEVANFVVRTAITEGQLVPQPGDIDLILPVPIEGTRLEARGYNQAALLGEALARHYGVPCSEGYLLRHRGSHSQTALDRDARRENAQAAFYLTDKTERLQKLRGKRLLLVDDLVTTGSTLLTLTDLLEQCSVSEVHIFVAAVAVR